MSPPPKTPFDLARRMGLRRPRALVPSALAEDSAAPLWARESFRLPRSLARDTAREWFERYPSAAWRTEIESWRALPDGRVEFTMRRAAALG